MEQGATVAAISDSLTNSDPGNWLSLVGSRDPRLKMVCNAHPGWTTRSFFREHLRARAFDRIAPGTIDVYILLLGTNNLFEAGGGSDDAVQEATDGIVRIADHALQLSPGAAMLLAAPPRVVFANAHPGESLQSRRVSRDTMGFLHKLRDSYRELAAANSWTFVDLLPLLDEDDFVDAAHPNHSGNHKIADAIWGCLGTMVQGRLVGCRAV